MTNNNYLPTTYQQFIHASRYARFVESEKRRETWDETVSRYFDFMQTQTVDPNQKVFFHADGVPGNVIVNNGEPTYIDPDGTMWMQWDMFLQKLNEHHFVWWNEYTNCAHRGMAK